MNVAVDNWQCNSLHASALKVIERSKEITFFLTKVVRDTRSIATETLCPAEVFLRTTTRKTVCLLPSVVKLVQRNTKAAIFSNEGCLGLKTSVRQLPNLRVLVNMAVDIQRCNSRLVSALKVMESKDMTIFSNENC